MSEKDYTEEVFRIREYSKAELAERYAPNITRRSALGKFYRWIHLCPPLLKELNETGYRTNCRLLTPRQVEIIVRHLGAP